MRGSPPESAHSITRVVLSILPHQVQNLTIHFLFSFTGMFKRRMKISGPKNIGGIFLSRFCKCPTNCPVYFSTHAKSIRIRRRFHFSHSTSHCFFSLFIHKTLKNESFCSRTTQYHVTFFFQILAYKVNIAYKMCSKK